MYFNKLLLFTSTVLIWLASVVHVGYFFIFVDIYLDIQTVHAFTHSSKQKLNLPL